MCAFNFPIGASPSHRGQVQGREIECTGVSGLIPDRPRENGDNLLAMFLVREFYNFGREKRNK